MIADITLAEVSVITQLATSAVLWPSTKPALLDRRLPWKLFSQLLVEVLRLPIANTDPFQNDRLVLPTKGCLQLDDLIPDAMCLLSALTGTFLNAMRLQGKEPEHFKDYILPLVMTTLQKHYQQPWGGILVLLLASFMGQLGRGVILKLKKEVPQESFQDAVWTGEYSWHRLHTGLPLLLAQLDTTCSAVMFAHLPHLHAGHCAYYIRSMSLSGMRCVYDTAFHRQQK